MKYEFEQKEWEKWCENEGYFFAVCKEWDEFIAIMRITGIEK